VKEQNAARVRYLTLAAFLCKKLETGGTIMADKQKAKGKK